MPPTAQKQDESRAIGPDGMVRVYDTVANKWVRKAVVDAREMVQIGTGSWEGPAVEVEGPAGRVMVNRSEVAGKVAEGHRVVDPNAMNDGEDAEVTETDDDNDDSTETFDFSTFPMAQLRGFADQAGIVHDGMSKAKLCAALNEKGFRPQ